MDEIVLGGVVTGDMLGEGRAPFDWGEDDGTMLGDLPPELGSGVP